MRIMSSRRLKPSSGSWSSEAQKVALRPTRLKGTVGEAAAQAAAAKAFANGWSSVIVAFVDGSEVQRHDHLNEALAEFVRQLSTVKRTGTL